MTQYPTIPFKTYFLTEKNRIWNNDPQPHLTSPPSFKIFDFWHYWSFFSSIDICFWVPLEDNKSCIFELEGPLKLQIIICYHLAPPPPPPHTSRKCVLSETVLILSWSNPNLSKADIAMKNLKLFSLDIFRTSGVQPEKFL